MAVLLWLASFYLIYVLVRKYFKKISLGIYLLLTVTFGRWWVLAIYLVWFVAVWMHMVHGFWSMFQTVGWNGSTWFKRLKVIGVIVATLIVLLFVATAVNAFVQANFIA